MIPFYEFGQWWHRSKTGERVSAVAGAVVILALIAWALVPSSSSSSSTASAATQTTGTSGTTCPKADGPVNGVTAKTIKIALVMVNVTGIANNSSLGIAPLSQQKAGYEALVKATNAAGGIACHQVVPDYIEANPADQPSLQQTCLQIVQDKPFAVLDGGAYAAFPIVDCFPQHKLPYLGGYILPQAQMQKFYPYLFEWNNADNLYQTTITALNTEGFFNPAKAGQKLGIVYQDCNPQHYTEVRNLLTQYQVPASSIVTYDVGCPSAFTSSVTLEQAILKFKAAHVTNVTTVGFRGDFPTFTDLAQAQHFNPKYGLPDDQIVFSSYGTSPPNPANLANAIAVSQNRDAEAKTPGYVPSAGTTKCNKILATVGLKPVYDGTSGGGGPACNLFWELTAAVDHEPTLSQSLLPQGLKAAKSIDYSYPQGPNDYTFGTNVTWGGQYYRLDEFHTSCNCWQLMSHTFARSNPITP